MTSTQLISLKDETKVAGLGRTMTISKSICPAMQDETGRWMSSMTVVNVIDDATQQRMSFDLGNTAQVAKLEHFAKQVAEVVNA